MRVVVDTNVLVSSFFGGPPREVIEHWKRGEITLCVSRDLIDEYVDVLDRLGVRADLIHELLDLFASGHNLVFTASTSPLQVLKHDPDDNMLFECAVELEAKVIVTGDKAVRSVERYMDIEVVTPAEFLTCYSK
ncbi:MAG: putative toxin-antitoxin system toxin component, PIN family [Betaproteobacteria bacterium]|nr:putative toxin-antitoxin system toxin component, PIN family [Betaproteobacteria bacterium]